MPSETVFRFKNFNVFQGEVGLKVNTDAVILGAWIAATSNKSVLEIGSGTGVISAILSAQSPTTSVTAIDIHPAAVAATKATFTAHPNTNKLHCFQQDVLSYLPEKCFDVLVCNPPYFDSHAGNTAKMEARQQLRLSYASLIGKSVELITRNATFYLVIPYEHFGNVQYLLLQNSWYVTSVLAFSDKPNLPWKRILIKAERTFKSLNFERIHLFDNAGNPSDSYKNLVANIYETLPNR